MKEVIVIPARYASTRFPAKPLAKIAGKYLIERVWELACRALDPQQVIIATDHQEIKTVAESFGAKVVMTPENCQNGSERVYAAIKDLNIQPEIIVNFQGDAVLPPPWILKDLLDGLRDNSNYACATPVVKINNEQYESYQELRAKGNNSGTFAVINKDNQALYFSNAVIPYYRKENSNKEAYKHIGIYAYTYQGLENYLSFEKSDLEKIEELEQLRMLENGIDILTVPVDLKGRTMASVDNPEDVKIAENIISQEGELI